VGTLTLMPDHFMNYVESDAPRGLTLVEWRRTRLATTARKRTLLGLLRPAPGTPRFAI
jgi:hypothetical protein